MKASEFNLAKDLRFDPQNGLTTFRNSRILIFDANAIGLLRQNLIETLGFDKAREFFLRFGYQNGYANFMQMKLNYTFDSELELLSSGPMIHTWEGIVHAQPTEIHYDRAKGDFYFTGIWANSYEAHQHLCYRHEASVPVCWSLTGYASGWCTAFFGSPLLAIEPLCVGKGDDHCEWKVQPPAAWGDEANLYLHVMQNLFEGK
jgi:hypothetical protein